MSTLLKDIYSPAFYNRFADVVAEVISSFNKSEFIEKIFDDSFNTKALKERMKHTSQVLHQFFPDNYTETVSLIKTIITKLRQQQFTESSIEFMFFPDYIETYGLDNLENSVKAIEFITQFTSCEFAVRPFILKYGERMLRQMEAWSLHENYKVRRLASEGSRPRLPWAIALPQLKKDPSPILPLLENLKNDPSEWVRRSVANNLNDISKDHPDIVIDIAKRWNGISKETNALIKHGCRTLLKQGHGELLSHYGLSSQHINLSDFKIITPKVQIGNSLHFSFSLINKHAEVQTVRLEYAIYYKRQNGHLSKKIFKISEKVYQANQQTEIQRKHSFRIITTRKFYTGRHQLSIIINGQEKHILNFELIE